MVLMSYSAEVDYSISRNETTGPSVHPDDATSTMKDKDIPNDGDEQDCKTLGSTYEVKDCRLTTAVPNNGN
ncbi:hypothetical protein Tco_0409952 [Tanacetum coccineum]